LKLALGVFVNRIFQTRRYSPPNFLIQSTPAVSATEATLTKGRSRKKLAVVNGVQRFLEVW
jgi:hypothetical protein